MRVVDAVDPNQGEADRGRDVVTDDGVNQLLTDDAVMIEGLSIGEVRGGYACVRGCIVPGPVSYTGYIICMGLREMGNIPSSLPQSLSLALSSSFLGSARLPS